METTEQQQQRQSSNNDSNIPAFVGNNNNNNNSSSSRGSRGRGVRDGGGVKEGRDGEEEGLPSLVRSDPVPDLVQQTSYGEFEV